MCTNNDNIIFQVFAAGSVASSCCLFQLIINLLSTWNNILHIGCLRFNGTLGPLRPYTRFMTLAWLVWNWISISIQENGEREHDQRESEKSTCCAKAGANTGRSRRMALLSSTVLCLTLMFMPEMLEQWRHSQFRLCFDAWGKWKINGIGNDVVKFEYVVDNMGCEAFIHAVEKLVHEQTNIGVVRSTVSQCLEMPLPCWWCFTARIFFWQSLRRLMRVSSKSSLQRNLPLVIFWTVFRWGWRIWSVCK